MGLRVHRPASDAWEWVAAGVASLGGLLSLVLLLLVASGAQRAQPAAAGGRFSSGSGLWRECPVPAAADGEAGLVPDASLISGQPCAGEWCEVSGSVGPALRRLACGPGPRQPEGVARIGGPGRGNLWLALAVVCVWIAGLLLIGNPIRDLHRTPARRTHRQERSGVQ
jgi:hypothetical protein